jgi:hypothetical protein
MADNFPKTPGACVDLFYKLRSERIELERSVKDLKEQQDRLEEHIFNVFKKGDLEGCKGKTAVGSITRTVVPDVQDWDSFYAYMIKSKQLDLLERRPSRAACRERWDNDVEIPGVAQFEKIGLSVTKTGGSK